jgi:MFS family permease
MPALLADPDSAPTHVRRPRLPANVAFYLQASMVVFFLAGSSAPTPLYAVYQAEWGFSPITTTVVFGVYAVAVLVSLLIAGSLSDHVGRRPVLLTAVVIQALVMLAFAGAPGVPELLAGRVVQGLSTGAALGALGAGMLDLNKAKGTLANAVSPATGTATGAIGSGVLVQYLPAPTKLVYLVLFGVFVLQAIGVALMAESSTRKPGALASLRPRLAAPATVRRPLLVAIPALVAVWALAGLYGALGPTLVRLVIGQNSFVLGGLALFALAGAGAVTVLVLRNTPPRLVMFIGAVALLVGTAVTLVGVASASPVVFFAGTLVAGVGFGAGFQGGIRTVVPLAAPHQRSGVLSTVFVVSYLSMGVPAVIAGFLVVHGGGVLSTTWEYGAAVMVLAALALVGLLRRPARQPAAQPVSVTTCPQRSLAAEGC